MNRWNVESYARRRRDAGVGFLHQEQGRRRVRVYAGTKSKFVTKNGLIHSHDLDDYLRRVFVEMF